MFAQNEIRQLSHGNRIIRKPFCLLRAFGKVQDVQVAVKNASLKKKMLECTSFLEGWILCAFSMSNVFLCIYAYRIHSNFFAHGKKYIAMPLSNVVAVLTTIVVYIDSDCPGNFLNWGAISFALSFLLLVAEICAYCTHVEQDAVQSASITTDQKIRLGRVLTMGELAATISEHETQRQFYARFSTWGRDLCLGDLVSFRIDPSLRTSGRHIVGSRTYRRYYCEPVGQKSCEVVV